MSPRVIYSKPTVQREDDWFAKGWARCRSVHGGEGRRHGNATSTLSITQFASLHTLNENVLPIGFGRRRRHRVYGRVYPIPYVGRGDGAA